MECRLRFTTLVLFSIALQSGAEDADDLGIFGDLFGFGKNQEDAVAPASDEKEKNAHALAGDKSGNESKEPGEKGSENSAKDGVGIEEPGNGMKEVLNLVTGSMRRSTEALKKASEGPLESTEGWVQKAQTVLMNTRRLQQKAGKMLTQLENAHRRLRSELQYKENGVKTLEYAGKDFKTPEAADQASQNFGTESEELFTSASDDSASETTVKNSIASEASDGSASQASHGSARSSGSTTESEE